MHPRDGRTLTYVTGSEAEVVKLVAAKVKHGSTVHADEASHWDKFAAYFPIKRINHKEAYSKDGACTNQAESFFPASAALKSAFITRLPVVTSTHTPLKWLDARIAAVNQTAPSTRW